MAESMPPAPERAPDFHDAFSAGPDPALWIDHYLPHWTTPERSAARYTTSQEGLHLLIEDDQLDWRPEDAPLRVSNLQTGNFAGVAGSSRGMHRHRPDGLTVLTTDTACALWTPSSGRIDVTVSATRDEDCMLAVWLVGTEERDPRDSGEICVFEIDAAAVQDGTVTARTGVKAHGDNRLQTDMTEVSVRIDVLRPHTWSVEWRDGVTNIGCNGSLVRSISQAPDYPLALMVDLFEIGPPRGAYPKSATIHEVRGWHWSLDLHG